METIKILSVAICKANLNKIYVFGDNLMGIGKGGQAVIRYQPNAFGIPTKIRPSMRIGSFFTDHGDNFNSIDKAINKLIVVSKTKIIVFPEDGIGTGLAKMKEHAPELFIHLKFRLAIEFGYTF